MSKAKEFPHFDITGLDKADVCDQTVQDRIAAVMGQIAAKVGVEIMIKGHTFISKSSALQNLAEIKLAISWLRKEFPLEKEKCDQLEKVTNFIGVKIALLNANSGLCRVRERIAEKGIDDLSVGDFVDIGNYLDGEFAKEISIDEIRCHLREKSGGFRPIPMPQARRIVSSLQADEGRTPSNVFGLSIGGTNYEKVRGSSVNGKDGIAAEKRNYFKKTLGKELKEQPIDNWDKFWDQFLNADDLEYIGQQNEDNFKVGVTIAAPIEMFTGPDGLTDGYIMHWSDKFVVGPQLGPRNAVKMQEWMEERWRPNDGPSIGSTLSDYLFRKTGKRFTVNVSSGARHLSVGHSDTAETMFACCTNKVVKRRNKVGGMICGTGFNVCDDEANLELGHLEEPFRNLASDADRITAALAGGSTVDAECFCSGKQLNRVFQNTVLFLDQELGEKIYNLDEKKRDQYMFALWRREDLKSTLGINDNQEKLLFMVADRLVNRAIESLAKLLAAVAAERGVDVIVADGSYITKENEFRNKVNERISVLGGPEDMVQVVEPPVSYSGKGKKEKMSATMAGLLFETHAQGLLAQAA